MTEAGVPNAGNGLEFYTQMTDDGLISFINSKKEDMGDRLLILGHHYQRDSIINLSHTRGDSYELARAAAESDADHIVLCGVRFMAEAARVLAGDQQHVFHPNPRAGCPMAGMADMQGVLSCWESLSGIFTGKTIIPITYMNSTADLKAFCGKNGGLVCTSSNAASAFQWAYERGDIVLFFPDEHLGTNTADGMAIPPGERMVWNFWNNRNDLAKIDPDRTRLVLWKGFCHVHAHAFRMDDVRNFRDKYPDGKIIVHPETPREVVEISDASGSTSYIIRYVDDLPEGSTVAIGTEINMVNRLRDRHRDRVRVVPLSESVCHNMARIDLPHLAMCVDRFPGQNEVCLSEEITRHARVALERMLEINRDW